MKRRLFWQIYGGFVAIALLCVAVTGLSSLIASDESELPKPVRGMAELIVREVRDDDGLRARARELGLDLGLWDARGQRLGATSETLEGPAASDFEEGIAWRAAGSTVLVQLEDGRWLGARAPAGRPWLGRLVFVLLVVFVVIALGAWPIARRITRRLEALQVKVERWGAGELSARAAVRGTDEVAQLAEHFNVAADRIEALVAGQKRLLANASHELRSPLARLRMGLELIAESESAERRAARRGEAERDIAELDGLIGDLLLASRLDARALERPKTRVDLGRVVAAEAARAGVSCTTEVVDIAGDEALLVRMVRNLVENAVRYGGGADAVEVVLRRGETVTLTVDDRGPGVPEAYRESVFEPFFRLPGHREGQDGGVGLGLSLVRDIAALHGGTVRCLARDGGGSRFVVTL